MQSSTWLVPVLILLTFQLLLLYNYVFFSSLFLNVAAVTVEASKFFAQLFSIGQNTSELRTATAQIGEALVDAR